MIDTSIYDELSPDLRGVRVGLSGAIPERQEWGRSAIDTQILDAVTTLADTVFSGGGHLVHGSHPSFTPRILRQAEPYARERGEPVVTFVMSGLFADSHLSKQLQSARYEGVHRLVVVELLEPKGHEGHGAEDPAVRNASLTAMREHLIGEMDALVIIGGKCWRDSPNKPGTLEELELARSRGIPCYLLGGLGGMARELTERAESVEFFKGDRNSSNLNIGDQPLPGSGERGSAFEDKFLDNGLTQGDNQFVQQSKDTGRAIAILGRGLEVAMSMQRDSAQHT